MYCIAFHINIWHVQVATSPVLGLLCVMDVAASDGEATD